MSLFSWIRRKHSPHAKPYRASYKPQLEKLEDRLVPAVSLPFSFLAPGFTQELVGPGPGDEFFAGVAFAPDGDPMVNSDDGVHILRYDLASSSVMNGSTIHPFSTFSPGTHSIGLGLTNNPDGNLYFQCLSGVFRLDAKDAHIKAGPFGPGGDLGIATDPKTNNMYYQGGAGISFVNPALTTSGTISSHSCDGLAFNPSGDFVFLSESGGLTVLKHDGTFVQHITNTVGGGGSTDGIAFAAGAHQFVVSNNTNGTMTRYDFPGNDFTQAPTETLFASGGFRGDMAQVGPDGFLYLTQEGTRFADGTTSEANSLVRIGPGFAPPAGVGHRFHLSTTTFFPYRPNLLRPSFNVLGWVKVTDLGPDIAGSFTVGLSRPGVGIQLLGATVDGAMVSSRIAGRNITIHGLKHGQSEAILVRFTYPPSISLDGIRKLLHLSFS